MFFSSLRLSRIHHFIFFYRFNHSISQIAIEDPLIVSISSVALQNQIGNFAKLLTNSTSLAYVRRVHDDILRSRILEKCQIALPWNNIMRAYIRNDSPLDSIQVYLGMVRSNVLPDRYSLPIILKASVQIHEIKLGKQIHSVSVKLGFVKKEFCESGIITLYCKAGEIKNARKVFDENPKRKLGSWNAIIGGLTRAEFVNEAIKMFIEMKRFGFQPDDFTLVSVISACGGLGNLSLTLQLHKCVLQAIIGDKSNIMMMNSLTNMYGKCGRMDLASKLFDEMPQRNVISWTSMIVNYATHGETTKALECFQQMRKSNVRPNNVTFVGILTACVHGGLVEQGKAYFAMMKSEFELEPSLSHYGCLIDLLSRNGQLKEAKEVVEKMPMKANVVIWGCLMGGCEKFGDVEMAEWVARHMLELEPDNSGVYVVLSNVYALKGMWNDVERVRKMKKLAKIPAFSSATSSF